MSQQRKVEELYPRAPRYTLQISDDHILRFAHQPKGSKAMHTIIVDLSESGMAFLVPVLSAPKVDEKIKVEFTAPNCDPIACFAKVVRIQKHRSYDSIGQMQVFRLVAVEFENLYEAQRKQIAQGLAIEFKKQKKQYERQQFWLGLQWFIINAFRKTAQLFSRFTRKLRPPGKEIQRSKDYIND